jgi:hypothetical protein
MRTEESAREKNIVIGTLWSFLSSLVRHAKSSYDSFIGTEEIFFTFF